MIAWTEHAVRIRVTCRAFIKALGRTRDAFRRLTRAAARLERRMRLGPLQETKAHRERQRRLRRWRQSH